MEKTSGPPASSNFQLKECDFIQVCRCCLSRENLLGELHTIQWKENDDKSDSYLTIADLYKTFCNIQVKTWQKLPQYICLECVNVLTKFKLFTSKCRQVEDNLQKLHATIQGDNLQIITIDPLDVNTMTTGEEICNDSNRQTVRKPVIPINVKTDPIDSPVDYSDEEDNAINYEEIESDLAQIQGGCLKITVEPLNVKMTSEEEIRNDSDRPIIKKPVLPINVKTESMDYDEDAAGISTTLAIDYEELISSTEICNETSEIDQPEEVPSSRCSIRGMFNDHTYSAPIPQSCFLLTCQTCQAIFKDVRHIASHKLQTKHFDESGDKCDICSVNLSEFIVCQTMTDHLTNHAEVSFSAKVDPRKGHICDQKKYRLRDHVRTHTAEKLHVCKLCDRRFFSLWEVGNHIHQNNPNNLEAFQDQDHSCVYCGDHFDRVQNLEIHLSVEHSTPDGCFECFLCRRRFGCEFKLNNHLRRHW